jgi:oligopeptidase B
VSGHRSAQAISRRRLLASGTAGALSAIIGSTVAPAIGTTLKLPRAPIRTSVRTVNGIALFDPYGWLKADNWREVLEDPQKLPPDIRRHIEAENAFADSYLEPLRPLMATLKSEIEGRMEKDDSSPFMRHGMFEYATAYVAGAEHYRVLRRQFATQRQEVVLDFELLAKAKDYFDPGGFEPSPDHRLIAWSADRTGAERFTIRIRDVASGRDLPDIIESAATGVVWSSDGRSLLYQPLDDQNRSLAVAMHRLGTSQSEDRLLLQESDPSYPVALWSSASQRFAVIAAMSADDSEVTVVDLEHIDKPPRRVIARGTGGLCMLDHDGERFLISTDLHAEEFRIVAAPEAAPEPRNWIDIVPHDPRRTILSFDISRRYLVWLERVNALPRIIVRRLSDGQETTIAFPDEEAYALALIGSDDFNSDIVRFTMSSPVAPEKWFDYDMATGRRVLLKEQRIPSGHDPRAYVVRRFEAPARDGETIPVTLLYRKGQALDGSSPLLLEAYGAYSLGSAAEFQSDPFSLVDRGMIYGIAHVRGGDDKGRAWYKAGRRDRRNNTFNDYIDVCDHLIERRFTAKGRIVGLGASAGGTLMGVVVNRRPDLFAAIVADVPFVDVVNTLLDPELPLTPSDYAEFGDPLASRVELEWLLSYSPYDNITRAPYPAILAVAGLTDSRVTYWEPAKWVARLRANTSGDQPILLKTAMASGHLGESGRFGATETTSLLYAFACQAVRLVKGGL